MASTTTAAKATPRRNRMDPIRWIPSHAESLLDVGCNVGALLADCAKPYPAMRLAGVDVNPTAIEKARRLLPAADLHCVDGDRLPFADSAFDCVTCIEVLEHIPTERRAASLKEMRRVLKPGGTLVLRTPHAGVFAWLDSNNVRFRLPGVYGLLVGRGRRDAGYADGSASVVWHYHFKRAELVALAGDGWLPETTCYGGLALFPIADWLCWPFYRMGWLHNGVVRLLSRVADFDYSCDYGTLSYGILLTLRRA